MIFILGGRGFLGSALAHYCKTRGWSYAAIGKDEYPAYIGRSCDLLINAAGNSRKFLAQEAPIEDFDLSVRSVRTSLEDFRYGRYIQFSSADVYPDPSSPDTTREDVLIDPARQSRYGFHKYLAEQCVHHRAPRSLILRLSGFVGTGMRKNGIYDLLKGSALWVDPGSEFQFMHTQDLSRLVFELADRCGPGEIVNVGAHGVVSLRQAAEWAGVSCKSRPGSPLVRCELNLDKLAQHCTVPASADTVRTFVSRECEGAVA